MATSIPKSLKDAEILLADADGGAGDTLTLSLEDGDFSFTLPDTHQHVSDRGAPGNLIDGPFEPITFSMTLQIKGITGTDEPADVFTCTASGWDFSVMDTSSGDFSALTLTAGTDTIAASAVNVFQMKVTITDPGDASTEVLYFANCTASVSVQEGMPNKMSVSGTCYMTARAFMSNINAS